MSAADEALELRKLADNCPEHSIERVDLLESAARLADSAEDVRLGYDVRKDLIEAAMFSGEPMRALVAFAWCLALCDERPDEFPESELHWHYKWVAGWATEFVEIDRRQLSQLFDDMEARFRKRGLGQDAVLKIRAGAADHLGDDAEIEVLLRKWRASKRDALSDCQPCDLNEQVRLLLVLGRDDEALDVTRKIIAGRERCVAVPAVTYSHAIPPLLRRADVVTAQRYHRIGFPPVKRLRKEGIASLSEHLLFTAVTHDLGRGLRLLRESLPLAGDHPAAACKLRYLAGAQPLVARLAQKQKRLTLALPSGFGGDGQSRAQETSELAEHLLAEARAIARKFDERNGNTRNSHWLEQRLKLGELSLELPPKDQS